MQYMLSSSNLTYKHCQQLTKHVAPVLLNAFGIQKNCSRTVLFSTHRQAGLNVTHPYHLQGLEKLRFYFMHTRKMDTVGKMIAFTRDITQLELGTKHDFLSLKYKKYKHYVTPTWLTHLWNYTNKCGTHIHHIQQNDYTLPRQNDFFIMDTAYSSTLSREQKQKINLVRQQLKVLTAADIVLVGSGRVIHDGFMSGKYTRNSSWKWPRIGKLPKSWTEIWQSAITNIIEPILNSRPLGRWTSESHQIWQYNTNPAGDFLARAEHTYLPIGGLRRRYFSISEQTRHGEWMADVEQCDHGRIRLVSHARLRPTIAPTNENNPTMTSFTSISDWRKRNWGDISSP